MSTAERARTDRVEIAAPAKLNLALLVGPVRPDGFHEIASLMVPVTLADRVIVEKTPGAGLDVVCDVAPGADNLAAKMVRELEERLGPPLRGARDHREARAAPAAGWAAAAPTPPPRCSRWSACSRSSSRRGCATRSPRPSAATCRSSCGPARSWPWGAVRCSRTSRSRRSTS